MSKGERRMISLPDFLTEEELEKAIELGDREEVLKQIIEPNMARINEALGQENDTRYLSFLVEYVMLKLGHWK